MADPNLPAPRSPDGQVLIYRDGSLALHVRVEGQTVWLTQAGMADLFQTTPQNVTIHVRGIYEDGELNEAATCKEYLQVRLEGGRQVQRSLKHYNLDMILAVGYRVRSPRGTAFRQWATAQLRELCWSRAQAAPPQGTGAPRYLSAAAPRKRPRSAHRLLPRS